MTSAIVARKPGHRVRCAVHEDACRAISRDSRISSHAPVELASSRSAPFAEQWVRELDGSGRRRITALPGTLVAGSACLRHLSAA